ncbi:MAG: hypothetical protein BGO70_15780 [Bacteroidetes bacterium 43-93]|nr:MAG: hypothetical protein BGO70_15780 [Bacteroidetes bacterium 43-93]
MYMAYSTSIKRFYSWWGLFVFAGWFWFALSILYNVQHLNICILKAVTGMPCPACGTTRSINAITKGNWNQAFLINPFGYPALAAMIILPVWLIADVVTNKCTLYSSMHIVENRLKQNKIQAIALALIIIVNWIWNIYKHL